MLRGSLPPRARHASLAIAIAIAILGCDPSPPSDPAMALVTSAPASPSSAELLVHLTADDPRMKDSAILLAGEPIDEPIFQYGPFVMNTRDEIEQAIIDVERGRFGPVRSDHWTSSHS